MNAEIKRLQMAAAKAYEAWQKADRIYITAVQAEQEIEAGDKPNHEQAARIKNQPYSYGVHFLRRKALRKGKSPGMVMKSTRLFGTKKEAEQHGKRFTKKNDHADFSIVYVNKRPNAWINWKTGKTNPAI